MSACSPPTWIEYRNIERILHAISARYIVASQRIVYRLLSHRLTTLRDFAASMEMITAQTNHATSYTL